MTLSVYVSSSSLLDDTFAVYVSFAENETLLELPTETKFDLLFIVPNATTTTSDNIDVDNELRHTIFLPPEVHLGNGTYIFGVKLISRQRTCPSIDRRACCF
jgi:hypothetical protein